MAAPPAVMLNAPVEGSCRTPAGTCAAGPVREAQLAPEEWSRPTSSSTRTAGGGGGGVRRLRGVELRLRDEAARHAASGAFR